MTMGSIIRSSEKLNELLYSGNENIQMKAVAVE
jgi:hypothetical protein